MSYENLIAETHGHVGLVRLNRPEHMNALNSEMMAELSTELTRLDSDAQIGVIIITGSDKQFATGFDVKELQSKKFPEVLAENYIGNEWEVLNNVRKPVIAAVSGYALGSGCELAMMCDFIVAADSAKFGQPELNLGIIPGLGGSQRLTRLVGKAKSMDMILTGRCIDADEAERVGLVSRIVAANDLLEETIKIAEKIAEKGRLSVIAAKEAINMSQEVGLSAGARHERRLFLSLFATSDKTEGMDAFVEKREAQFEHK